MNNRMNNVTLARFGKNGKTRKCLKITRNIRRESEKKARKVTGDSWKVPELSRALALTSVVLHLFYGSKWGSEAHRGSAD